MTNTKLAVNDVANKFANKNDSAGISTINNSRNFINYTTPFYSL